MEANSEDLNNNNKVLNLKLKVKKEFSDQEVSFLNIFKITVICVILFSFHSRSMLMAHILAVNFIKKNIEFCTKFPFILPDSFPSTTTTTASNEFYELAWR